MNMSEAHDKGAAEQGAAEDQEQQEQQQGAAEDQEQQEQQQGAAEDQEQQEQPDGDQEGAEDEGRTFGHEYVKRLREESKGYRTQLRDAEAAVNDLKESLWATKLAALGKLADPTDLPLSPDVDPADDDAVQAAVDELLQRKPHLAARRAAGDLGQHDAADDEHESFSILGAMQQNA